MTADIARLLAGDSEAWEAFVDRFTPVIWAAAKGTLFAHTGDPNEEDVRELVQSVFVRLAARDFRLLKTYDASRASLVTWLTVVARSAAIDSLRRRRIRAGPLDGRALEVPAPEAVSSSPIELPPGLLSPRQKLVLHLICDRGMEAPEIAAMLGVDAQTVRSTLHKAAVKLRKFFRDEA